VQDWLGLLRTIDPAESQQGRIIFDVPAANYKLRILSGEEAEDDDGELVEIPLRMPEAPGIPDLKEN
jgi:hypothetical protein